MADLPDFNKIGVQTSKGSFRVSQGEYEALRWESPSIDYGFNAQTDIYTVPAGKVFYITDVNISANFRWRARVYTSSGRYVFEVWGAAWDGKHHSFDTPIPVFAGETLKLYIENHDIQSGYSVVLIVGWLD